MAITGVRGRQILDGSVGRADLNTTVTGDAVIRKLIQSTGLSISSTGVDAGTGDVTITLATSGVGAGGTFGSSTLIPVITVDTFGRITAISTITATGGGGGGGGITWSEIFATTATAAINTGYIANNASLVTITLPATAAVGSIVEVTGKGAGGWKIAYPTGDIIHFGNLDTTISTGYLQSSLTRDSVRLVCVVADAEWNVISSMGNITIV